MAALPGTAFGPWGEGFLRLSYANSVANIQAALDAIKSLARLNVVWRRQTRHNLADQSVNNDLAALAAVIGITLAS